MKIENSPSFLRLDEGDIDGPVLEHVMAASLFSALSTFSELRTAGDSGHTLIPLINPH